MASDSTDSHRRKHRPSSPSDDDDHNSKRHKHRHHHRHHRHHHHRHDKNQDEESKEEKVKGSAGPDVIDAISANYDMEEGEIVEDEGIFAADGEIGGDKGASDVESGEIKVTEGRSDLEDSNTGGDSVWEDKTSMKSLGIERIDDLFSKGHIIHNELSPTRNNVNGDVGYTVGKGGSRSHGRSRSPLKESSKGNIRNDIEEEEGFLGAMEVDEDASGHNRSSPSHRNGEHRHRASLQSPLHGRYHYGTSDRNRSESPHRVKERSHSQSFLHEGYSRKSHHHGQDDVMYDHDKANYDDEGERTSHRGKDSRHNSIHSAKNKEIKTSNYDRYIVPEYTNYDRDFQGKEREKKIQKDHKGEKDQEHRRDRSHKDKERDREQEKEQTHSHGKDSEKEKELDRYKRRVRERSRDLAGDREWDRERRREKDRGRSKEREIERERRRDSSKAAYRDRDIDRDWEKGGSRDRKLEREREREKDSGRYNGRDRYRDKGRDAEIERIRRHHRLDGYGDGYRDRERNYESRRHAYDGKEHQMDKTRKHDSAKEHRSKDDSSRRNEDSLKGDEDDQDDYRERVELELAEQEEEDLNRIKEESRRRREAILQKYKTQQSQNQSEPQNIKDEELQSSQTLMATLNDHPEDFDHKSNGENVREPSVPSFSVGKSPPGHESSAFENKIDVGALGEGTPKSERSTDMFCDDIFGDSPAGVRKAGKGDGLPVERSGLHDNWDDPEGYYGFRLGEILDGRYEIAAAHGKGVFSTVVRARDLKAGIGDPEEVAIKIIRNNETMLKAGTQELVILKKLVGADPESRRHCVRYISNFKYRNHLCIVFESLHMNLREVLKKFGRNIGLKLTAVRAYAKQLFIALKHLRNCGVLHCDIKPDNMLVNDAKNVLKLCDFGNAMFAGKNEITPYLVSRFYRAPEIILGLPYDHPVDIWSVGCCLYELYSGKVLFPGTTNNDMLRLHMELKGSFPKKMLRKGAFTDQHFDQDLNFLATEEDPVTKKTIRRLIVNIKPKDISTIIKGSPGEDPKMLANFKDLLDKIFVLDPEKRLTVSQALNHPFITGK